MFYFNTGFLPYSNSFAIDFCMYRWWSSGVGDKEGDKMEGK